MPDATALAAAIADGRTTARAVMAASLAACEAQAGLGAVVFHDDAMARAGADAADTLPADRRGPFHGVPFLMKDLGAVAKGLPATAGAAALRRTMRKPDADSDLCAAFRNAGMIPFGVTATPPFGLALSSAPEDRPLARNPWKPDLTPGGSSGGAAAAVASGIVAIAHATDAAGSIRVHAACCGLIGLKPSRGAVPMGPDFANHLMGIASELVLARSLRDVRRIFEAVHLPLSPVAAPAPVCVGLALPKRCGADQIAATRAVADALADAGCEVREVPAPDEMGAKAHALVRTILSVSLAEWLSALNIADESVPPLAAALAAEGQALPATKLLAISRELAQLSENAFALFESTDALLCPVLSSAPPSAGSFPLTHTDTDAHFAEMEALAPNAALANAAGLPALAFPFGMEGGLPLGAQLIGPPGADRMLCDLAAVIEARAPAVSYPAPIAGLPQ